MSPPQIEEATDASPQPARRVHPAQHPALTSLPHVRQVLSVAYVGRCCLAAAIFLAGLWVWEEAPPAATRAATLILLITGAFTAASFWYTHLGKRTANKNFIYAQLVFDAGLITWMVYFTGGEQSGFAPLYILVIVAGGYCFRCSGEY